MFKLIKTKHSTYPDLMSASITIFKGKNFKIRVQEFYKPHYIEFSKWIRSDEHGFLALKKWKKFPLSFKHRKEIKEIKCIGNIYFINKRRRNII